MILVLAPYFNRHICDICERLARFRAEETCYIIWEPMPEFRRGNEWDHPPDVIRLEGFGLTVPRIVRAKIEAASVIIALGFFQPFPAMPRLLHYCLRGKKKVYVASEGLRRVNLKPLRTAILRRFSSYPSGTFLAIGRFCDTEFRAMGLKWPAFTFGYAEREFDESRPRNRQSSGQLNLLAVGQLIERKAYDRLLEILARVNSPLPKKLKICGDGPERARLEERARSLDFQVEFEGFVSPAKLGACYQWADIFIHPANYEGWGVAVNHALEYGLALLLGQNVRSGEGLLVRSGWNGRVCSQDDEFVAAIEELARNPGLLNEYKENSRRLHADWNLTEIARRLNVYIDSGFCGYRAGTPLAELPA